MTATKRDRIRTMTSPRLLPSVVELGYFKSKLSGYRNGVYFEDWDGGYRSDTYTYVPEIRYGFSKVTKDEVHDGPPYREGGPLKILSITPMDYNRSVHGYGEYTNNLNDYRYVGGFMPPINANWNAILGEQYAFPGIPSLSPDSPLFPDISSLGDRAWRSAKPKLELASGFVFVAEARDIPRMLKTTSGFFSKTWKDSGGNLSSWSMQPKEVADHYINHEFGWKPFLSDLSRFDKTLRNVHTLIKKLSNENGQEIRRRVTMVDENETDLVWSYTWPYSSDSYNTLCHPINFRSDFFVSPPSFEMYVSKRTYARAVGKFTYYRPEFDLLNKYYYSAWNTVMRYMTLYGLRVSPSNIYKATPWTWALDWITNIGDRIDHLTDIWLDSMAAKYLYVTHYQIREADFVIKLPFVSGTRVLTFSRQIETKQRAEASSPYGFGLSWDSLSPRQLAIAGALGISRRKA